MFNLTVRTRRAKENLKIATRENAEYLANEYYDCVDTYAVEITNCYTGELLYYKAKS